MCKLKKPTQGVVNTLLCNFNNLVYHKNQPTGNLYIYDIIWGKDSKMNNNNKITLSTELDLTKIDKQISELQRKIKNMREFGPTGGMSQLAQQYRAGGNEQRAKQLEEFRQRQDTQNRRILQQDLQRQDKLTGDLLDKEKRINAILESRIQQGKDITKARELEAKIQTDLVAGLKKEQAIREELKRADNINTVSQVGKFGGGGGGGGGIGGIAKDIAGKAGAFGPAAIGAAIAGIGKVIYEIGTKRAREVRAEAGIANVLGEVSELQSRRRGYEMNLYAPERLKALEAGRNEMKYTQIKDITSLAGLMIGGAGTGFMTGMKIAPSAGAMGLNMPRAVGTVALSTLAGAALPFLGEKNRSLVFDRDFYNKQLQEKGFKTTQEQYEYEKAKNFEKVRAAEYLEQNSARIQSLQRAFGMSDKDLFQGGESLFQRGAKAGFTTDTITSAMQAISGAGGTSAAARGGGIYAAQMARGLNLTNAGELLGRISGATGMGAEGSKDQLIRMYAEATKIGLDASEFAKETRTFLDTAASMAYESGTSFKGTAELLGQGMGLYSERGIAASKNALERLKQETGQTGGLTGQYQVGFLQSKEMKEILGRSPTLEETATLGAKDVTQFTLEDEFIQSMLRNSKIPLDSDRAKKFIKKAREDKIASISFGEGEIEALKEYQTLKESPMTSPEALADARSKVIGKFNLRDTSFGALPLQSQYSSVDLKAGFYKQDAGEENILGKLRSGKMFTTPDFEAMMKMKTGKLTDDQESAAAQDDLGQLQRLTEKSRDLAESFVTTTARGVRLAEAMGNLATSIEGNQKIFDAYAKVLKNLENTPSESAKSTPQQQLMLRHLNSTYGNDSD